MYGGGRVSMHDEVTTASTGALGLRIDDEGPPPALTFIITRRKAPALIVHVCLQSPTH